MNTELAPVSIGLFAKYPEPGQVKTRLIPLLGEQGACDFARYLLLSAMEKFLPTSLNPSSQSLWLWRSGGTEEQWSELLSSVPNANRQKLKCRWQVDQHLGARMQHAMHQQLQESHYAILIGTDAIEMTASTCNSLLERMDAHEVGFVPAQDGGYVAIACSRVEPAIFHESIAWGTAVVLNQSLEALSRKGLKAVCLEPQLDIDEPEDYLQALDRGLVPPDWQTQF